MSTRSQTSLPVSIQVAIAPITKRAVVSLAVALGFLATGATGNVDTRPSSFRPDKWTVKVFGSAAPGSGVVISADNTDRTCIVLTAGHVLKGTSIDDEPYAVTASGRRLAIKRIRHLDPLDLAEVGLADCELSPALQATGVHPGGKVWVAGFPQESNQIWIRTGPSEAGGSSPNARAGGYAIFHGAPTRTGISGGGLYDSQGLLIGIHGEADTTTTKSGKSYKSGIGLAIPIQFLVSKLTSRSMTADHQHQWGREEEVSAQNRLLRLAWLESSKHHQEALALAGKLINAQPTDPRPRIRRAGILMTVSRYDEALVDYNVLIRQDPGHPSLHINRGNALMGLKRYAEALLDYDRALAIEPKLGWGHLNRAKALIVLGRTDEAATSLNRALSLAPSDRAALLERAVLRQRLGQLKAAQSDLDALIEMQPDHVDAYARRGQIRGERGDLQGSLEDMTTAVSLQPEEVVHRLNRGVTLARLKRWDEAEQELQHVLSRSGKSPELLANLAEVVYLRGRHAEACRLAEKATKLGFQWTTGHWDPDFRNHCNRV